MLFVATAITFSTLLALPAKKDSFRKFTRTSCAMTAKISRW